MADALDDGLELDTDLVAFSGDEGGSDTNEAVPSVPKVQSGDKSEAKKRRRKEQRQKKAAVYRDEVQAGRSVAQLPADQQADFLATQQQKTFPKLSTLELQELKVPVALPTSDAFSHEAPWVQEHGAPLVLVVSGNAQRAADIARALRALLPDEESRPKKRRKGAETHSAGVAKLFARHFKVSEQVAHLRENATPLAVGTPHRVEQLLEQGALRTDHLGAVVVDHSWTDAKMRTIFDTPETRDALVHLLSNAALRPVFQRAAAPCRLLLY